MYKNILIALVILWSFSTKSNTFSEVFGSEGASGIENPKTRSLSFTLQYATLAGSIGYVIKQLHDTGFMEPLGYSPGYFEKLSPLAYKKNFIIDKHAASVLGVNQKVDKLNYMNGLREKITLNRYSIKSIEQRSSYNFSRSINNFNERQNIVERYYEK